MDGADGRRESLERMALGLEGCVGELNRVISTLRRAADAEALRQLALGHHPEIGAAQVRAVIAARRLRREYLDIEFGDPAWALLLELFAARLEGYRLTMTALGEAAGLRATTALRWVHALEEKGLIRRHADPEDERLVLLDLTENAADAIRAYLTSALTLSPWLL